MKKLLVLVLVLGLVSTASATMKELRVATNPPGIVPGVVPTQGEYYDPIDSQINLKPSDYLWIGVYNTVQGTALDPGQESMFLLAQDNGGGEWTGAWKIYGTIGDPGYQDFYNEYIGKTEGVDAWILNMGHAVIPPDYVGVGVVDAKEFHCLVAHVDVLIQLWDSNMGYVDSFIIHQVPEPMTICLLGLGGLFLRRRK